MIQWILGILVTLFGLNRIYNIEWNAKIMSGEEDKVLMGSGRDLFNVISLAFI
jgi:hypothetical protein